MPPSGLPMLRQPEPTRRALAVRVTAPPHVGPIGAQISAHTFPSGAERRCGTSADEAKLRCARACRRTGRDSWPSYAGGPGAGWLCAAKRRPARKDTGSQRKLPGIKQCSQRAAYADTVVQSQDRLRQGQCSKRSPTSPQIIRSIARIELVTLGRFMLARSARQLWRSMTSGRAANNGRPGSPDEIVAASQELQDR